jgi:cysteine synthase
MERHDQALARACDGPSEHPRDRWPGTQSVEDLGRRQTPLVHLRRVAAEGPPLLAKLEWYGATGSVYDRTYPRLFDEAESRGALTGDVEVLEAGMGIAGLACATVSARRGYHCTVVVPSRARAMSRAMQATGASVELTPGADGDAVRTVQRVDAIRAAAPARYWVPDHFANPCAVDACADSIAPEIWGQTGGTIGAVVAGVGCGAILTGLGRYLHARDPRIRVYAVEPEECPLLSRGRCGPHVVAGLAPGFIPENLDLSALAGVIVVGMEEGVAVCRRLAREEGLLGGLAAGFVIAAALKLAQRHGELATIVAVLEHGQ